MQGFMAQVPMPVCLLSADCDSKQHQMETTVGLGSHTSKSLWNEYKRIFFIKV